MLTLSAAAIIEKNNLAATGAWLVLAEVIVPDGPTLRLVNNTDDITWNSNTWTAFPFELDPEESTIKGDTPVLTVRIGNVTGAIQGYLEDNNGLVGAQINLYVVHSAHLDLTTAEVELNYSVLSAIADASWVTFELGADTGHKLRFPRGRLLKNYCRWKFQSAECAYAGVLLDNAAAVDKGDGTVGLPSTGHGLATGETIEVAGTTNYDGTYTVLAASTANEIVVTAIYAAETFAGTETVKATACSKTLMRCRELANSARFGGFPGVGSNGLYA